MGENKYVNIAAKQSKQREKERDRESEGEGQRGRKIDTRTDRETEQRGRE